MAEDEILNFESRMGIEFDKVERGFLKWKILGDVIDKIFQSEQDSEEHVDEASMADEIL